MGGAAAGVKINGNNANINGGSGASGGVNQTKIKLN